MRVKAQAKYLPMSPRKLRLVAGKLRGREVSEAEALLKQTGKKAASLIKKVVHSAGANAVENHGLEAEGLVIDKILVDEGPRYKRQDRHHGARFSPGLIQKRSAHVTVWVTDKS